MALSLDGALMPLESPLVGGSGGGGGSLPQPLDTTDSVTFAGLTLTGFSGILRASSGVLAAGWYVPDQTNPASTGFIRMSNASAIMARNNTNSADWTLLTTDTKIKFGSTTGPAVSILSAANVAFGDSTIWATVDSTGITLEGNSATALYGGDTLGDPFSLIAGIDADVWIGDNVGSVIVNIPDASFFTITNNGVQTCRFTSDGGESFQEFTDAQPAKIRVNTNTSGNGKSLGIYAGSSGGSNGDGGDLTHAAGEKNGSGTHGRQVFYVGGQEVGSLESQGWCQWGSLWTLKKEISLISSVGTTDTLVAALPSKFLLRKALLRLSTVISGSGALVASVGSTSGGDEILLATESINSGSSADLVWGQEPAVDCGTDMLPEYDYCGLYVSATNVYIRLVTSTASITAGALTLTLEGIQI